MSVEQVCDDCRGVGRCDEVCMTKCSYSMKQGGIRLPMAIRGF